jgi:hypothetical protein
MRSSGRGRILSKECLYRRYGRIVIGIVASWCLGIVPVAAQMPQLKRPEEAPTEKPPAPPPKKLVNEPRAVGLLQLNKSGKGTLIPIAIRIDGKFYDASIYKADPVPMALDVGTVYEVEKTGQSEGLFTVSGALHNQNPNSATPWLGAGAYALNGAVVANNIHKAEDKPRGLDNDNDAPPRLTRGKDDGEKGAAGGSAGGGGASQKTSAAPSAGSQPASGTSGGSPAAAGPAPNTGSASTGSPGSDDSGRPQLKRSNTSDTSNGAGQSTTAQNTKGAGEGSSAQPTTGSSSGGSASGASAPGGLPSTPQGAQSPSSQNQSSQNRSAQNQSGQNYYRPMLRRGKPTQSAPEDTPEELTRTTETGISKTGAAAVTAAAKPPVELVPAISDAGGALPESFQFFWKQDEEEDRKKQMLELAANSVQAYLATLAKDTIPAKPAAAKAGAAGHSVSAHKPAPKVEPEFEDVEFRAFDVWRNNQPVMVLTAEAHLPEKVGSKTTPSSTSGPETYYVTIAARTDIYGDLRKLYAGVTDKFHLDVTPKLELIDAVDADGNGRGELLFRETTEAGNGYLIYRPTGDTLWKTFDSLNPE